MFGKTQKPSESKTAADAAGEDVAGDMALDTLAGFLRSMAEFALEHDAMDVATFRATAEAWAKHVTIATPPPGAGPEDGKTRKGRREWEGLRRFVREYCQLTSKRVVEVSTDLRQVIWVFIRNLSQAFAEDAEVHGKVRFQLVRLESLVEASGTAELKREVLGTVTMLKDLLEERSQRQTKQMQSLGAQVQTLGHELESARKESETDPLTRISNRKAFDEYLSRSVEVHKAFSNPMSMLIVDIDHFKTVNDSCGHVTGDDVLCQVADALIKVFLRKNDFVSRLGGDEFAIILRDTGEGDARVLAERVLGRIRALRVAAPNEQTVEVSVSIGLATMERDDDEKTWLARADRCLYAAKAEGRDRVSTKTASGSEGA
jgi:diguanylate cyclase